MTRIAGLVLAVVVALVAAAGPARGIDACDEVLVDNENVLGNDRGVIEEHADALTKMGVVMRIRTVDTTNGVELGEWVRNNQAACESWRTDKLIAMVVATTDLRSTIVFGPAYKTLMPKRDAILDRVMVPHFNKLRWSRGLLAGVDQLVRSVKDPDAPVRAQTARWKWITLVGVLCAGAVWLVRRRLNRLRRNLPDG